MKPVLTLSILILLASLIGGCQSTAPRSTDRDKERRVMLQIRLGTGYMQKGEHQLAMDRLNRALEIDPDSPDAHNAIALLYERVRQNREAEEHYSRATRLDPKFSAAHNNYGGFLCRNKRFEEGEKEFMQAAANPLYRNRDVAYANAGLCLLRSGDREGAEGHFREALALNKQNRLALMEMAQLSLEHEQYLSTRGYLQRYHEIGPKTARSLWLGYQSEESLGDKDAAASYAMQLQNNFPEAKETSQLSESQGR